MRPDETLGSWVAFLMHSLTHSFAQVLRQRCQLLDKPYTITPPQWATLAWIDTYQVLSVGVLAQHLGIDDSVATGIVKRLESQGLIERVHDQVDRRIVRLSLTGEGHLIVHQLNPVVIAFNERSLQGFSPEQRQHLLNQLRQIVANIAPGTRTSHDDHL